MRFGFALFVLPLVTIWGLGCAVDDQVNDEGVSADIVETAADNDNSIEPNYSVLTQSCTGGRAGYGYAYGLQTYPYATSADCSKFCLSCNGKSEEVRLSQSLTI